MNASPSRGTIAQVLTLLIWLSNLSGHSAVATVLHDPNLATELTTFLALAGTLWGVGEHLYAALTAKKAAKIIANAGLPPPTLTRP